MAHKDLAREEVVGRSTDRVFGVGFAFVFLVIELAAALRRAAAAGGPASEQPQLVHHSHRRRVRKKYWLWPIFGMLVVLGFLIVLAQGSAVAPFIYTLFC